MHGLSDVCSINKPSHVRTKHFVRGKCLVQDSEKPRQVMRGTSSTSELRCSSQVGWAAQLQVEQIGKATSINTLIPISSDSSMKFGISDSK